MQSIVSFSTEYIAGCESVRAWREFISQVYFRLDVYAEHQEYVRGSLRRRLLADMAVSELQASAHRLVRTEEMASLDEIDNYVIVLPETGNIACHRLGSDDTISSGQVLVINSSESYEVEVSDGARMVCFDMPGHLLRGRIAGVEEFRTRGAHSDPLMVSILRAVADRILNIDTKAETGRLQNICFDLLDIIISNARGRFESARTPTVSSDLLLSKVRRIITDRLSDRDFHLDAAAVGCGVSKRHLQGVLSQRGTTFSRELMDARLAEAARLLTSTLGRTISIGQIASRCGFASQAHFATAYRKRFGKSPRDDHLP